MIRYEVIFGSTIKNLVTAVNAILSPNVFTVGDARPTLNGYIQTLLIEEEGEENNGNSKTTEG